MPQSTDPLGQHFAHSGSFHDEEISAYCYSGRTYLPQVGRFAGRTRLGYGAGANLYEFCASNPMDSPSEARGAKGTSLLAQAPVVYGTGLGLCHAANGKGGVHRPTVPELLRDVDKARIWPKEGPNGEPGLKDGGGNLGGGDRYKGRTNDCDDFATRLYNYLKDLGYDVTFTIIRKYKANGTYAGPPPRKMWKLVGVHCYVDVHTNEGMIWLEAQKPGTGVYPATSLDPPVDLDGDGVPQTSNMPGNEPHEVSSDGETGVRTEVYASPQEAAARNGGLD